MFRQTMYSKYQKRVIKFLTDLLGTETPFTYEKTQTNHLKVLIDGVPKPMYTGSTPSDRKSIDNFMADVKRELKASKINHSLDDETQPKPQMSEPVDEYHDRIVQSCVKTLRSRLGMLKSQEQEKVLENRSVDGITDHRSEVVKNMVALASQARKPSTYIKHQEIKSIENMVLKHLKFMMPTLAHYSELLESKSKYKKNINDTTNAVIAATKTLPKPTIQLDESSKTESTETLTEATVPSMSSTSLTADLMAMQINSRINLLRNLSKRQALQLIDDIEQAMALNREQDIAAVVALIKEKGVPLEAIIERLSKEA
ncbi:MAG TPA: hypothetical protein VJY63_09475 [Marinospirillum sp.]|uniref:hypothetical protein n=1 Tax=Marinospirillum sp. TaxID=2183934 RepID=UPI002B482EAE|nr:hypothetical protein [Marinospirillum sp.]HKM16130.1 hypothetical protein [Marinospirillum sp.]